MGWLLGLLGPAGKVTCLVRLVTWLARPGLVTWLVRREDRLVRLVGRLTWPVRGLIRRVGLALVTRLVRRVIWLTRRETTSVGSGT